MYFDYFPSNLQCLLNLIGKTSIRIKQNPIIFVRHFSFLSDQNFQIVGQLSSNNSEDFAKTDYCQFSIKIICYGYILVSLLIDNPNKRFYEKS